MDVTFPTSFFLWKYGPKMLKEKDSNLINVLCRVNCHILLITTLSYSFICFSIKSHICLQRNIFYAKCEPHFTRSFTHFLTKIWSHYSYWLALCLISLQIYHRCFRLINIIYLVLFQWLPSIQLCRYDIIYIIIPLLNSINFLHRLAIVKMLYWLYLYIYPMLYSISNKHI